MTWPPDVKKQSEIVRRILSRSFLNRGTKKLSSREEKTARQKIYDALQYLDQNAINLGHTSLEILDLLGPSYGRMPDNLWLYPADARDRFYVVSFVADKVADKYFAFMHDVETGR